MGTAVTQPTVVILPTVVATIRNSLIKTMIMLEHTEPPEEPPQVVVWVMGFTAFGAMDVSKSMRLNLAVTTPGKTVWITQIALTTLERVSSSAKVTNVFASLRSAAVMRLLL